MLKKIKNMFKKKEQSAEELIQEVQKEQNEEMSLTFKMPKQVFKDMLPIMDNEKVFPIQLGEAEMTKIVKDFMVDGKSKIELNYGDK